MRKFFRGISITILIFRTMDRLVTALGGDIDNPKCDGTVKSYNFDQKAVMGASKQFNALMSLV